MVLRWQSSCDVGVPGQTESVKVSPFGLSAGCVVGIFRRVYPMISRRFTRFAVFLFVLVWAGLGLQAQQPASQSEQNSVGNQETPNAEASAAANSSDAQQAVSAAKTAADAQATSAPANAPALQQRDVRYKINKSDVLSVNFVFTPEYDQNLQVQPDGYVVPRGVPGIHAEGMTIPELKEALEKEYSAILHDPVITVLPTNVVPAYFIAGGEVNKPGRYNFEGDTTVTQAVEIAGGFTSFAKHSQVVLFRRINNDWVQGTKIDVKKMLKDGNLAEDLHLQPGDMLYVPKNTISKVQPWLIPFSQFVNLNLLARPISF
jgi:protein involved in polysaccharide export with SLBB domain